MAPTAVRVVEDVIRARNAGELHGPLAARLARLGSHPLELHDYRSVGDKVIAIDRDRTLVFTVRKSEVASVEVFEPGRVLPDALLP